jgi:oxygen-independent coproporphyrinogen-3 oxidase
LTPEAGEGAFLKGLAMTPDDRAAPAGPSEPPQTGTEPPDGGPSPLPGLYVHIPFCLRKCPYCSFYSVTDRTAIPPFLTALKQEAKRHRGFAPAFDTLYLGGGTPSVLAPAEMEDLIASLRETLPVAADAEVTVEANPGDVTDELLAALTRAGVNRLNLGIQSFDEGALELLGRRHSARQALAAFRLAREAGFANLGLDLIYGLPSPAGPAAEQAAQSASDAWTATLAQALELGPEHLSCYQLTPEPGTPLAASLDRGELLLPGESAQADYFLETSRFLEERGYGHYEVSNFCLPGHESRHNGKYWTHVPYLGLGPAAHSFAGRQRRWNHRDLEAYLGDLEAGRLPVAARETLTDEQLRLEALFLGFRMRRGIDLEDFRRRYGMDLLAAKGDTIGRLSREGLLESCGGFLRPTRRGLAVADSLALI